MNQQAAAQTSQPNLKFLWNGIKDNGGAIQSCFYSDSQLLNHPVGTLTIYARNYRRLSAGVQAAFTVQNDTDIMTDYFDQDRIRVEPTHPLYAQVQAAMAAAKAHNDKMSAKRAAKRGA